VAVDNPSVTRRHLSGAGLVRSGLWVAADNWSQQLLQFLCFLYVGNIIGPTAIGQMTIALTYMLLMHALLINGFTNVIVQREDLTAEHYNTAFWANAGLGLVAMILSAAAAPLIGWTLGEPTVAPLILALSPICLAMGLISFFEAKVRRELRFNSLAGRSIASVGTGFLVAGTLAIEGYGVWSLVAYQLVWRFVELVFVALVARWRPTGFISRKHLTEMLDFSLHSIGIRLVDFFAQNVGRILIGYLLGMHALGLYQLARRFVEAPLNAISGVFQGLTLPVFARLQNDRAALAGMIVTSVQFSTFVLLPAFVGLMLVAPVFVETFLKSEWAPVVPLVQIFCVMGLLMSVTYFFGSALLAIGRAALTFRVTVGLLVARIAALACFAKFGLAGIAGAEALVVTGAIVCWYLFLHREVPVRLGAVFSRLLPAFGATLAMAASVFVFREIAGTYLAPLPLLVGMVVTGLVTFGGTVLATSTKDVAALRKFVRHQA